MNSTSEAKLEREEKMLLINLMNLFFSLIPTAINVISKWWVIDAQAIKLAESVPINALGFFSVGGYLTSTLEKIFKDIPKNKDTNIIEHATNIFCIALYSLYFVLVPVCYFTGITSRFITGFSLFTLLLRSVQCLITVGKNIANIRRYAK